MTLRATTVSPSITVGTERAAVVQASLGRPSWVLGAAVVGGIIMLQAATDLVAGRDHARVVARLVFLAVELPILMMALSGVFAWSVRRRLSAPQGLAAGVAIATLIGCAFGLFHGALARHVPELRISLTSGSGLVKSALFGALNAQLYFGLWGLAFIYPFAVESAGVRALEARNLRSQAELTRR